MQTLDDAFLAQLVDQYDAPAVTAFALAGSYARNAATRYSDVDLLRFVTDDHERGQALAYRDGRLVSVTTTTVGFERAKLSQPEKAIWGVPTLRRMRILLDRAGDLTQLQREAEAFEWSTVRASAEAFGARELMGYAEECHKILSAFVSKNESGLAYATVGLLFGMTQLMAVMHGVLIHSENSYFQEVGSAVGSASMWTRQLRRALGLGNEVSTAEIRAQAALALYRETARLIDATLQPEQRAVIETCITILDKHTTGE